MRDYRTHKTKLLKQFNRSGKHCIYGGKAWQRFKKSARYHGVMEFITITEEWDNSTKQRQVKRIAVYNYSEIKRILNPGDWDGPEALCELIDESRLPILMRKLCKIRNDYVKCYTKAGTIKMNHGPLERSLTVQESEILKYRQVCEEILRYPQVYGHRY